MLRELDTLQQQAAGRRIPALDALMIALNACGAASELPMSRARMQIVSPHSDEEWQLILPLDAHDSPFVLANGSIELHGEPVCEVTGIENDDVVLTYLRGGGASLTLNTHSRSTCTGCLFCPNVIEDAADASLRKTEELVDLLQWVVADNDWPDLSHLEVITVCTGCFQTPEAALAHLRAVKAAATTLRFAGRLHLLSSVIRERRHLEAAARDLSPFHLTLTIECFTRRSLILKETKASLTLDDACRILDNCRELGILGDFTYVVGLDPYEDAVAGLLQLAEHCTTFPRLQVYQAHNDYMRRARSADADDLDYYFAVREAVEQAYARAGLRPRSWENYRPLWYAEFCGGEVARPRI